MKRWCVVAVWAWLACSTTPAQAQFFNLFRKSPPPLPPAQRVANLIGVLRSDSDEGKRASAAVELREFDPKVHPEITTVLAEAAKNDPRPGVRSEAVTSLVRMRPVSPVAGQAIEWAAAKDSYWRNRMSAQAALVRYRMAGYSLQGVQDPEQAASQPGLGAQPTAKGIASTNTPKGLPAQSQEPPLNEPPQVLYYDQNGKLIPAPKDLGGPVIATPSAPMGTQPFPGTGMPSTTSTPTLTPNFPYSQSLPAPVTSVPQAPRSLPVAPLVTSPPSVPAIPTSNGTTATEPMFRSVSQPGRVQFNTAAPAPSLDTNFQLPLPKAPPTLVVTPPAVPSNPGTSLGFPIAPVNPAMPVPAKTVGPDLGLPALPLPAPVLNPAIPVDPTRIPNTTTPGGPSLEPPTAAPSSRVTPGPVRINPISGGSTSPAPF